MIDFARTKVLWAPFKGMQTEAVNAREFEVGVGGSKGPGKTDVGVVWIVAPIHHERYKGYVVRETGPQLAEIKRRMHRLYPQMPEKPHWNGDGHGRWKWPSGAEIILESIGTPDEVEKIHGHEPSRIFRDEAGNVKDEKTIDLEQAEIRSPDPRIPLGWMGSANPGKPGHAWFKRRFVIPCGRDGKRIVVRKVTLPHGGVGHITRRFIPGTVIDNPIYANDPLYMARLALLPEVLRRQLLFGDWDAGYGIALEELDESIHIVRPFVVPDYWVRFGAFDYGYAHNWVWIEFCVTEDGLVYVVNCVRGRRHQPHQIAERVKVRLGVHHANYRYTHSDSYAFQSRKERDENAPTIADILSQNHDLILSPGNTDRIAGLVNLRYYTAWRGIGPGGRDGTPALRFMDTPGNRWLFEQCQSMVVDEDEMEDVLKVNSNPETGEGGDDGYDCLRVGMASRPPRAIGTWYEGKVKAFSRQTLAFMVEKLYRDVPQLELEGQDDEYTQMTGV